jgi:hypothetical protein
MALKFVVYNKNNNNKNFRTYPTTTTTFWMQWVLSMKPAIRSMLFAVCGFFFKAGRTNYNR